MGAVGKKEVWRNGFCMRHWHKCFYQLWKCIIPQSFEKISSIAIVCTAYLFWVMILFITFFLLSLYVHRNLFQKLFCISTTRSDVLMFLNSYLFLRRKVVFLIHVNFIEFDSSLIVQNVIYTFLFPKSSEGSNLQILIFYIIATQPFYLYF